MYIIKNAFRNVIRNKGRNVLVAAIIFAIVATTVVALIINNTSSAVIEDYHNRFGSEVTISPNTEKLRAQAEASAANSTDGRVRMEMPTLPADVIMAASESKALQKTEATAQVGASAEAIKAVDQDETEANASAMESNNKRFEGGGAPPPGGGMMIQDGGGGRMSFNFRGSDGYFKLYGDSWTEFESGERTLAAGGALPSALNECLISEDLAELNSLKVGDTITFATTLTLSLPESYDKTTLKADTPFTYNGKEYTPTFDSDGSFVNATRKESYTLTITGLYEDLTDAYPSSNMSGFASMNKRNEVFTTINTLLALHSSDESGISITATYYLKSPDLLEKFTADARAAGLSDLYDVKADVASYNSIVKPVQQLKSISLTFMFIVLGLGAIILILLTSIAIRERKYEIGVLRAMGMKKSKVALGLWTELLAITCACLILGVGVGAAAAQPITNVLLKQQAAAVETAQADYAGSFEGGPAGRSDGANFRSSGRGMMGAPSQQSANVKPLSEMKITIGFNTMLEIIGIVLLLASIAGFISISRITKYEPIKILMERN
ncbi:MAG: ABC transporter permease [Oscillospiraceae bacterium]|jgi:putative ABC transport system permease protein|nr:ABC transporter permease [Oscillospiraceae bacterium]